MRKKDEDSKVNTFPLATGFSEEMLIDRKENAIITKICNAEAKCVREANYL